jgi:predicted  nucleic acid-binding Zn-ribbon protein
MRDFNESLTVGLIVYSQTIFVCLRVVIWTVLKDSVGESALAHCESIIFSTDTVVTCSIYFFPKFKRRKDEKSRSSHFGFLTPSIVEKVKSGPFSSSNDNFGLSTGDSDIDPSDTFDATGPRFEYGSGNRNGSSDENNSNKNKNKIKLPTISETENHHQSRSKQIPPCPQCGYTYYLSIPSDSYDDEDDGESTSAEAAAAPLVSPQMDDVLTLSEEKKCSVTTDSDCHDQSQARSETTLSSSSTTGEGGGEESLLAVSDPRDSMFDSCTVDNDSSVMVDA